MKGPDLSWGPFIKQLIYKPLKSTHREVYHPKLNHFEILILITENPEEVSYYSAIGT
jgi:hypothetical protein